MAAAHSRRSIVPRLSRWPARHPAASRRRLHLAEAPPRIERERRLRQSAGPRPGTILAGREEPRIGAWAARLAYGVLAALAAVLVLWALLRGTGTTQDVNQVLGGLLLAAGAALAAAGWWTHPLLRHGCTLMSLWLMLSPLALSRPLCSGAMAVGLAAFLVSGAVADALEETEPSRPIAPNRMRARI